MLKSYFGKFTTFKHGVAWCGTGMGLLILPLLAGFLLMHWAEALPPVLRYPRLLRVYVFLLLVFASLALMLFQREPVGWKGTLRWLSQGICGTGLLLAGGFIFIAYLVSVYPALRVDRASLACRLVAFVTAGYALLFCLATIGVTAVTRSLLMIALLASATGNIVVCAPLLKAVEADTRATLIASLLLTNPFTALVTALPGYDPLRTEWLYLNCPIGAHYPFTYPAGRQVVRFYWIISSGFFLLGIVAGGSRRMWRRYLSQGENRP